MRRRRGVRGEEVGVKKFNMTLKKKSVWEHAAAACQGWRTSRASQGPVMEGGEGVHSLPLAAVL